MSTIAENPIRTDLTPVRKWRFDQLRAVGYPYHEARLLSELRDVDLHLAVRLVESGCPVDTALRILL